MGTSTRPCSRTPSWLEPASEERGAALANSRLARDHTENRGVLAYLSARPREGASEPIARPSALPDPYREAGSHPDVVERVWDDLGRSLGRAARALVHGAPALVHEEAGIVLAVALGTAYALRLPPDRWEEARRLGLETCHTYRIVDVTLDLASFGPAWHFGAWKAKESAWLLEEHARLETQH